MMTTTISSHQRQLLNTIFSTGNDDTEEEVLDEALELLSQRDELRQRLDLAVNQLARGEGVPAHRAFAMLPQAAEAAP